MLEKGTYDVNNSPTACHPRKKTRSSSRERKLGSVYHEAGGVNASSRGIVGSKSSSVHRIGRAAETPEIRKEWRRERGSFEGERNDTRGRVRVLEEGRNAKPCAIAIRERIGRGWLIL